MSAQSSQSGMRDEAQSPSRRKLLVSGAGTVSAAAVAALGSTVAVAASGRPQVAATPATMLEHTV